jgi:hypothetical protein
MSTARIGLNNGSSCVKSYGIDQTRPAIMNDYISDYEWEQFCDEIDNALAGMNLHQTFQMIATGLTLVTFIVSFAVSYANFGTPGSPSFAIFALPAISIVCAIAIVCYGSTLAVKAKNEMQAACVTTTSTKQPRLSFHVRYEYHYSRRYGGSSFSNDGNYGGHNHTSVHTTQYIEVSINQDTVTIPIGAAPAYAAATAPTTTGVGTGATTATDRLVELDKIKHLLSPSEYEEKRTQIIKEM